jgi:hypothetical protein
LVRFTSANRHWQCAWAIQVRANKGPLQRRSRGGLFDHLVGAAEQRDWESQAKRLGGLEIDNQLDLRGLFNW